MLICSCPEDGPGTLLLLRHGQRDFSSGWRGAAWCEEAADGRRHRWGGNILRFFYSRWSRCFTMDSHLYFLNSFSARSVWRKQSRKIQQRRLSSALTNEKKQHPERGRKELMTKEKRSERNQVRKSVCNCKILCMHATKTINSGKHFCYLKVGTPLNRLDQK